MNKTKQLKPILHSANSAIGSVCQRIYQKMRDYAAYRFTAPQSCAINIFFDLVQEYDEAEKLYVLSVLILRMFFRYDAELYLKDKEGRLKLATPAVHQDLAAVPDLRPEVWQDGQHCYIPVRGKDALVLTKGQRIVAGSDLMGMFVIRANWEIRSHDLLFLEKFANRVGFCLHNKILSNNNAKHILFVRKLAHDIGHNIITPNMRLKLMLNHLERHIEKLAELVEDENRFAADLREVRKVQQSMSEYIKDISGTFKNSALFLESLLRQSHFDLGHYVLRLTRLDIRTLVVVPQFERYRQSLKERSLHVEESQPTIPEEPCMVQVDLGLISQVLANLLSNAVKYASEMHEGRKGEVRCSVALVPAAFGSVEGVKVSVFSSGPHLDPEDAKRIFDDNYRAPNATGQTGTGHGLFFVREIAAEHGGSSGYEAVEGGNVFYFILPRVE